MCIIIFRLRPSRRRADQLVQRKLTDRRSGLISPGKIGLLLGLFFLGVLNQKKR